MENILVATDGSKTSNKALMEARKLAELTGSKVKIIHVRSDLSIPSHISTEERIIRMEKASIKDKKESLLLLDEALKIFQGFPGKVNTLSRSGDPGEEIIKEAEKENYDLIIIGSRGLGKFSRTILGSVSNKVSNNVNKNVLIIKWIQN